MRAQFKRRSLWLLTGFLFLFLLLPSMIFAETDVTDTVEVQKSRLVYDRRTKTSSLDVSLKNTSPESLVSPVKVVLTGITPSVTVSNADGNTAAGLPYFEYGSLTPGQASAPKKWVFHNPGNLRFSYQCTVLDGSPSAILVKGKAIAGIPVVGTVNIKDSGNPARTSFSAINADGSYTLAIDDTWTPPFLLWAEGWVTNKHLRMLSCFDLGENETEKTVNVTPATTAIVEAAMEKTASEIVPESEPVPDLGRVAQIKAKVEETLEQIFAVVGIPAGFDLFESPIGDTGSPADQLFDVVAFSVDDQDSIVLADAKDPLNQALIDPDSPDPVILPQSLVDGIDKTDEALTQIRQFMGNFYALINTLLFQKPLIQDPLKNAERKTLLETQLLPGVATGFLNNGGDAGNVIDFLSTNENSDAYATFIGCAIHRPMKTQHYGTRPVQELPDGHTGGLWVHVTTQINGKSSSWLTSFADTGNNTWKWYGNRIPFRRSERGRTRARQMLYTAGATTYQSGIHLWHNDVGNLAMDKGITRLAVFNPAFAPETIDGVSTNCVRLERRAGGLDTRYRLTHVPTWWIDDGLYQLSKTPGDRLIDHDLLKTQTPIEMVVIGLDNADTPVSTWIYTIPEPPLPISELKANPGQYFAAVDQDSVSFKPYDPADPTDPDAFPGNNGLFSWVFPADPKLFPSWSELGWDDVNWNWNELQIDNPAWLTPDDFSAWTSDIYLPGPTAISPRTAHFLITMRDLNANHFETRKIWDPWSKNFIRAENDQLTMDVTRSWSPDNLNPVSSAMNSRLRIRGDRYLTRFEVPVVVESATAQGNGYAEMDIRLGYQPEEDRGNGDTNFIGLFARIRFQGGQLKLQGFVWGSKDAGGTISIPIPSSSGDYPYERILSFNQPYNLAVEYVKAQNRLVLEFDDGTGPYQSVYDMNLVPEFNGDDFILAEIRTRVRNLQQAGDAGSIRVHLDDARVDGALYDDFTGGMTNSWEIVSYE